VLSSEALYFWPNLASRLLHGDKGATSGALVLPMEAVDMSLYEDEYILLVMAANAIMNVPIGDLETATAAHLGGAMLPGISVEKSRRTNVEDFVPAWESRDVQQGMMAAVA
jgi:hypothetical protein